MILYIYEGKEHREAEAESLVRNALELYIEQNGIRMEYSLATQDVILRGAHGKPYFASLPFSFSVSHTGDLWCCLIADQSDGPVGLDIQKIKDVKAYEIGRRFFTKEEVAYIETHQGSSFFDIWVRKEAYVKYTGLGISSGLDTFSVVKDGMLRDTIEAVFFKEIEIRENVKCAVCTEIKGEIWTKTV